MGLSQWLTHAPSGETVAVQQWRVARLDRVAFGWRVNGRPMSPTAVRIGRSVDGQAVAERVRPGGHFAMEADWVDDPLHRFSGVGRHVLDFVNALPSAKLLAICRRDARWHLETDTWSLATFSSSLPGLEADLQQSQLRVAALEIDNHRLRSAAVALLRGGWHLGSDDLAFAAHAVVLEPGGDDAVQDPWGTGQPQSPGSCDATPQAIGLLQTAPDRAWRQR